MSADEEVLESPPARPVRPWLLIPLLAVVALVGWQLRAADRAPVAAPVTAPASTDPSPVTPGWSATSGPDAAADWLDPPQFLDSRVGFTMQHSCSQTGADGQCPRHLLATDDGGATWRDRGILSFDLDILSTLVPLSAEEIVLVDTGTQVALARSIDAGNSWTSDALARAAPAPAASDAVLTADVPVVCDLPCSPTTISWIDPINATVQALPTQPPATDGVQFLQPAAMPAGGDIVVTGSTESAVYVAMSTDHGQSWTQSWLAPGRALRGGWALAAGNGRAYAFVATADDSGATRGPAAYRTDDGGASWVALAAPDPAWYPIGVLHGELIGADNNSGGIILGSGGGTDWTTISTTAPLTNIVQAEPDGVLLAMPIDVRSRNYYLSSDGATWNAFELPPP